MAEPPIPAFEIIDQARRIYGISYYRLCRTAKVHLTTYYRALKGQCKPTRTTRQKLHEALRDITLSNS